MKVMYENALKKFEQDERERGIECTQLEKFKNYAVRYKNEIERLEKALKCVDCSLNMYGIFAIISNYIQKTSEDNISPDDIEYYLQESISAVEGLSAIRSMVLDNVLHGIS